MKRHAFTIKSKLIKALIIGICLTFVLASTVFAKNNNTQLFTAQNQKSSGESEILQKQKEIDKYIFEDHAKEIEQKGFKVTHTAPLNDYVEVGITPYTKQNADYIYKILGKDKVKVVEGQQAELMNQEVSTDVVKAYDNTNLSKVNPLIYVISAVVITCAVYFAVSKRKAAK